MGLANRIRNKTTKDVEKDFNDETGAVPPSGSVTYKNREDPILRNIASCLDDLKKDSVFPINDADWTRLQNTLIYSCTEEKYLEGTKDHANRTPHLKVSKDDMIGFIDNFRLSELNNNSVYQYKDDEIDILCANNKWKGCPDSIIYIIQDKITAEANKSSIEKDKLLTYFTCYEISRVLLQVSENPLVVNDDKEEKNGGVSGVYTVFGRTAISSGLAFYLCNKIYGGDINDIVTSVKTYQPLDFQTGCQYINHDDLLAKDIEEWLNVQDVQDAAGVDYLDVYKWFSKSVGDKSLAKDPITIVANWPKSKKLKYPGLKGRILGRTLEDIKYDADRRNLSAVSPICLNGNYINYDFQKALLPDNCIDMRAVGNAIEAVKVHIDRGLTDFLDDEVEKKLTGLNNFVKTSVSSVKYLLTNIPIYLVLHKMCGKKTSDGHDIPSDTHYSYDLSWQDFRNMVNEEKFDFFGDPRFTLHQVLAWYWLDSEPEEIKDFQDIVEHRRIFLYLDNIRDYARRNSLDFSKALMITLYHELGHALMDEYNQLHKVPFFDFVIDKVMGKSPDKNKENAAEFMYTLREESLANGLALYLLRNSANVSIDDFNKIREAEEKKSIPYSLGISYSEKECLETSIPIWMRIKKGPFGSTYANFYEWLKVVANGPFIPWSTLQPVENKLGK